MGIEGLEIDGGGDGGGDDGIEMTLVEGVMRGDDTKDVGLCH